MVINPIVGVYIPIIRIPIKGGMTIPNIATFDNGTYVSRGTKQNQQFSENVMDCNTSKRSHCQERRRQSKADGLAADSPGASHTVTQGHEAHHRGMRWQKVLVKLEAIPKSKYSSIQVRLFPFGIPLSLYFSLLLQRLTNPFSLPFLVFYFHFNFACFSLSFHSLPRTTALQFWHLRQWWCYELLRPSLNAKIAQEWTVEFVRPKSSAWTAGTRTIQKQPPGLL